MRAFPLFISLLLLGALDPRRASAFSLDQRCDHEWSVIGEVSPRHIEGRHAWAARCGVMSRYRLDFIYNELGQMASFTREGFGNRDVAPVDRNAPCDPPGTWKFLTSCPLGCFAETQELLFGARSMTIPDAVWSGQETIATLRKGSTLFEMKTREDTPISSITYGEEKRDLVVIDLGDDTEIVVTPDHPMVLGDGRLLPASELEVGNHLLTLEGPCAVVSLASRPPTGSVWNVRPASKNVLENILITQGVLTGSLRFQNEWGEKRRRLWMMDDMAADDVEVVSRFYGQDE